MPLSIMLTEVVKALMILRGINCLPNLQMAQCWQIYFLENHMVFKWSYRHLFVCVRPLHWSHFLLHTQVSRNGPIVFSPCFQLLCNWTQYLQCKTTATKTSANVTKSHLYMKDPSPTLKEVNELTHWQDSDPEQTEASAPISCSLNFQKE